MFRTTAIVALSLAAGLRVLEASVQLFVCVLAAASNSRFADFGMALLMLEFTTFGFTVATLVAVTRNRRAHALRMCAATTAGLIACLGLEFGPMREPLWPAYVAAECAVMLVALAATAIEAR